MRLAFDVIVVGVGGMGSAATYHLARRGKRVLALDRYTVPNEMGSSHGHTRIIRYAQPHPTYVVLVRRAFELWRELAGNARERLLHITGSLEGGSPSSPLIREVRASHEGSGVPFETLSGEEVARRFPGYQLPPDFVMFFQPDGGFLVPERCVSAHATLARELGATVMERVRVHAWSADDGGVQVTTDGGIYAARSLVLCAGPWTGALVPELRPVAKPERQVVVWLKPSDPILFTPDRFPVFRLATEEGRYYGFPAFGIPGLKAARFHHLGESCDPDTVDRTVRDLDEQVVRDLAARYFPKAMGGVLGASVCMFTNTPDEDFILDLHPAHPNVVLAAGFSGHGFKFCSVVGEICADLVDRGLSRWDIGRFRIGRPTLGP